MLNNNNKGKFRRLHKSSSSNGLGEISDKAEEEELNASPRKTLNGDIFTTPTEKVKNDFEIKEVQM
jgi:hypothetical protein